MLAHGMPLAIQASIFDLEASVTHLQHDALAPAAPAPALGLLLLHVIVGAALSVHPVSSLSIGVSLRLPSVLLRLALWAGCVLKLLSGDCLCGNTPGMQL